MSGCLDNLISKSVINMDNNNDTTAYTFIHASDKGFEYDYEQINKQYSTRIDYLMKSDKKEEDKIKEKEILLHNASIDPRLPNIFYGTEEKARKSLRIAHRLQALSDEEFLTNPYVLDWSNKHPKTWITTVKGDITKFAVDAIVNAANSSLLGGGGVDGAIHRAAGPELRKACAEIRDKEYKEGLPIGNAVITKGFNLPAKYVIHTVGPVWVDGTQNEPELLYACYINSLLLAVKHSLDTIAFPEISTGAYCYPKDKALIVVKTALYDFIQKYPNALEEILLVTYE